MFKDQLYCDTSNNSNQAVGSGQSAAATHPLEYNREKLLIAAVANGKT